MIDVAFTPRELRSARVAVVIDVLRATTTVAAALAAGHERVLCCEDVERAESLRGPGRVLAGERDCLAIPGFDRGNSPLGFDNQAARGDLVLSTTNGSNAIVAAAARSETVLLGALVNLAALLDEIAGGGDVTVVCAGTDGGVAVEDVYVAGLIVARLAGTPTDAALVATRVAASYAGAHREALEAGAHREALDAGAHREALAAGANARVLRETGQDADVEYCARESVLDVVPRVTGTTPGVAIVTAG